MESEDKKRPVEDETSVRNVRQKVETGETIVPATSDNIKQPESSHNTDNTDKTRKPAASTTDIQRNKRLFAGLRGHLGLAKQKLEKDAVLEKQKAVATTVLNKHEIEGKRIAEIEKKIIDDKRAKVLVNDSLSSLCLKELFRKQQKGSY